MFVPRYSGPRLLGTAVDNRPTPPFQIRLEEILTWQTGLTESLIILGTLAELNWRPSPLYLINKLRTLQLFLHQILNIEPY